CDDNCADLDQYCWYLLDVHDLFLRSRFRCVYSLGEMQVHNIGQAMEITEAQVVDPYMAHMDRQSVRHLVDVAKSESR
ncbi:MAG: hypothetical protein ACE5M4_08700, partial [Anaerolineales bacterium]